MKSKIIILFLAVLLCLNTYGQNFPKIKSVDIKCRVHSTPSNGLFFYNYKIKNDISSTGNLFEFDINISSANYKVTDTVGLIFRNELVRTFFRRKYDLIKGKVIPVGISLVPDGWDGSASLATLGINFSGFPEVTPGKSIDSIEINCRSLPSIRKVTFSIAKDTVIDQLPSLEDTTSTMTEAQMDSILASLDYVTWTVGPNVYPDDISLSGIVDSIKSYTKRSSVLGWIVDKKDDDKENQEKEKDGKLVKELIKYLDKAREQLAKNKIKEAQKQLKEFVEKVEENYHENDRDEEKEKKEHGYLTSEAYALLKYNAEYLIGKLK